MSVVEPARPPDGSRRMMTGSSLQKENPYQRKGFGTRMVRALIEWAKANGWERIEAREEQAQSIGIPPERACDRLVMRLDLA